MKKDKSKSFIRTCIITNIVSLLIIFALCMIIFTVINYEIEKSFPSLYDVLEYEEELIQDNYSEIPLRKFSNCSFIIYNSEGQILYESNKNAGDDITLSDLEFINEYTGHEYFNIDGYIKKDDQKNVHKKYYVAKIRIEEGTLDEKIVDDAVLNSNLEVIQGTLFGDTKKISEAQFELMQGRYGDNDIEKYQYENSDGEKRIIVFINNRFSEEKYSESIKNANRLWILAIPLILCVIFIETYLYKRKLKRCMEPLNAIISSYEIDTQKEVNENDVSIEFKPIISKVKQLLDKIEKSKIEKNKLIANISHDLKTPLTAIHGYAQAFKDNIVPKDKEKKYIDAIYEKSVLATDLIDRLFEYTKLEHPEYRLSLEQVDIMEFVKKYVAEKRSEIEIKKYILISKIPEKGCVCCIDKGLFTRLLDNLISNSLKYTDVGTKILIELQDKNDRVKIRVADNGPGIPEDIKDSLFEPFVTGNRARTPKAGTGLGMAIVRTIVDLHNGEIRLVEKPENGYKTEFNIEIKKV